ncbi:nuclease-related domain-containing protein [Pseudanabaena yagii]|uniref:NERD domain-containing protein n=1 Tax=Pseudanabaena yagii GIHE-NHR1 TaxID=2722753 RepID=A0ABX1LUJ3_9CYAN|nr:nuclease-related domain-containing protein [Pseudanabaena yagii]NMF59840.1 NERD domain-containing protein [Pseudanabaena yagii GIHE-NHR1]
MTYISILKPSLTPLNFCPVLRVFHSAWWQADKYYIQERESDFTIVHPEKGILLLEVKGGKISYDSINKSWYQNQDRMKRSPFDQAREIRYSFIKFLSRSSSNLSRACIGQCAAFPDVDAIENGLPSEAPRNILLLRPQLKDINLID